MKAFYETRNEPIYIGEMTHDPFPLHVHEIVEMVFLTNGECRMEIDSEKRVLHPGDAVIAFPLIPHSYDAISDGVGGLAAFFPADIVPEFSHIFHTMLPDEPTVRASAMSEDARFAARRLQELPDGSPSRLAFLHLLLAELISRMTFHAAALYHERNLGTRVVRYVYEHACENITLGSAAHDLGISESHLSHLFAQQFHVNFRRFINAIRVDKATMLMRDPYLTLTQICFQCGYENMRTFRRAFERETGELPAAYMRSARLGLKQGENA